MKTSAGTPIYGSEGLSVKPRFIPRIVLASILTIAVMPVVATPAQADVSCPTVGEYPDLAVSPPPTPGVDWSGCDFTGADLTGADLTGADLTGANLNTVTLTGANLAGTNLAGADLNTLSSGSITGIPASLPTDWQLTGGYLIGPGANLTGAGLSNTDLTGVNLNTASFGNADLNLANLSDANLNEADLEGAYLIGANLTRAILTGAEIAEAYLFGADLTKANLNGASIQFADFTAAFVSCGNGGTLANGIIGTPEALPSGWVLTGEGSSQTLTAPNVPCAIAPSTQTVSGVAGTAVDSTTAFTPSGFTNAPDYTYTVSPMLPAGLQLNAGNGVVSGTPTAAQGGTTYTITATSGAETATATVSITLAAAPTPDPGPAPAPAPVEPAVVVDSGSTPVAVVGDPVPAVEVITPTQKIVNEVINLSPTQVQNLTANQLAALPVAAFAAMTPSQVKALNPSAVKQLSSQQIAAISPAAIRAKKPRTLRALTPTQIRSLTTTQVTALRVKQIRALGPTKKRIVTRAINISNR